MIDWKRFGEMVRANQRFLLTSHIRPDCDALGSELGMAAVLERLGKQVRIVNGQATPPNLKFIDPAGKLQALGVDVQPAELEAIDVLLVLDTGAWAQLGPMGDILRTTKAHKAVLDHHVDNDDLGAEWFKDTQAEATGRLVVDAARELGVEITPDIARPLFAAMATDTGWFRFLSTTGNTYRRAGELVDAGARPQDIYTALYEQETLARLQLRGRILARTTTDLNGRLAYTAALREDFAATGALPSDTEDVINLTLAVAGVEVGVILVEQASGGFKISFRSRTPKVDCSELARSFGGGGHKAAAGAFIAGALSEAEPKVLDAVRAGCDNFLGIREARPRLAPRDICASPVPRPPRSCPPQSTPCQESFPPWPRCPAPRRCRIPSAPPSPASRNHAAPRPPGPRRGFFVKAAAVVIGGLVGLFPFLTGLVVFADPWRRKSAGAQWYRVGSVESLKPGVPQRVAILDTRRDAWSEYRDEPIGAVFLVLETGKTATSGKPSVEAFNSTCPHAGCSVGFVPARECFVCPCHTSAFALDGAPLNAVAPRGMDRLECEVRGSGEIWVRYEDFVSGTPEKIVKA